METLVDFSEILPVASPSSSASPVLKLKVMISFRVKFRKVIWSHQTTGLFNIFQIFCLGIKIFSIHHNLC